MKTIVTRKIDGIEIVVGFSELSIEPVETKKIVAVEIKKTAEYLAAAEKQNEMSAAHKAAGSAIIESNKSKVKSEKENLHREFTMFNQQAKGYENELRGLLPALKKKEIELRRIHAVYFEPKAGEYIKTGDEISALIDVISGLNGDGYVDLSGNVVEDNRGVVYYQKKSGKCIVTQINTIGVGVPKSGILYADLIAEDKKNVDLQIEINAAAKLSPAAKLSGSVQTENLAINEASAMRSQLEIKGETSENALQESQLWYTERLEEINLIFNGN